MKDYVIITDGCCDLPRWLREREGIEYIKMHIIDEGREVEIDLDWTVISAKDFYNNQRQGKIYKTVQVTIAAYLEHFERIIKEGKDILSLSCASGLSGSFNASLLAREEILAKYKDANIRCVDTLNGCMGEGLVTIYAARLRAEGKSLNEVADWVEENRLYINQIATVDDLSTLKASGRITGAKAFMSSVFNIKPMVISNTLGMNESVGKVVGRKKSLRAMVEFAKKHIIEPQNQTILIAHADCIEDAEHLKSMFLAELSVKEVIIDYVGYIVGASTGPSMIALYFYGNKVTESTKY